MGCVWLARNRATGSEVVVKRMRSEQAGDPVTRRRFQDELRTMMQFRHPNAVALLDASGADDSQPFLVMEYLHGITLHELLETEGRLPPERLAPIVGDLCVVLQAAHDQGILHRDLTPANVMIVNLGTDYESVKVLDFGLARLGGFYIAMDKLQGADAGIGGGTPDYVCPEQVRGAAVDGRGDLYSLGVLMYRALTGHLPFEQAANVRTILLAHRDERPPAFADCKATDVPAPIEALVQACLAKFPGERPQSARELAERFGAALGQPIVDPEAFADAGRSGPSPAPSPEFPAETLIDRFEAWMPEQIAVMKLRGFIHGVGGTVVDSLPGLIRVHLPGHSAATATATGFWGWLRSAPSAAPAGEVIELHLRNQTCVGHNLVDVAVVRPDRQVESRPEAEAGREHCRSICRELRAYLMIGR